MEWKGRRVLVTGGASFIGSRLVEAMVEGGARVRVVDDLSSGKKENIESLITRRTIGFLNADLRDAATAAKAVQRMEIVLHLAADQGDQRQ